MKFEEEVCAAANNNCLNGGTCYIDGGDEVCNCKPDYEGAKCETQSKYLEPWMYSLFEK